MSTRATLELRGLVLRVTLGVLPEEKLSPRDVPVDLSWTSEHKGGAPFDYRDVAGTASRFVGGEYDLLEDLAESLLEALSADFPAGTWTVSVRKPWPSLELPLECVSFTLEGGSDA